MTNYKCCLTRVKHLNKIPVAIYVKVLKINPTFLVSVPAFSISVL